MPAMATHWFGLHTKGCAVRALPTAHVGNKTLVARPKRGLCVPLCIYKRAVACRCLAKNKPFQGHKATLLWRTAADRFHLECWRSFAPYVHAFLTQAARDEAGV